MSNLDRYNNYDKENYDRKSERRRDDYPSSSSRRSRSRSRRRRRSTSHGSNRRHRNDRRSRSRSDRKQRRSHSRSSRRDESQRTRRRSSSNSKYYAKDYKEIQESLGDDEKDARTVNVWQLSHRVRTRDLEEFFGKAGRLVVVRLIMDPRTGKSRGVAYIQYRDIESVDKALSLTGQKLLGIPVQVRTVSSEKCRAAEASMGGSVGMNMKGMTRLCVANINLFITEQQLEQLFSPYGRLKEVQLMKVNGKSLGTAYITFERGDDARRALDLNNVEIAGAQLRITPVSETSYGNELSETDGIPMSASDRIGLMAKLSVGTGLQMAPTGSMNAQPVHSAITSQCFVLKNMFNVADAVHDEDFCEEIEEDVINECSKFGGAVHIHIDRKGASGNVYVKCPTVPVAIRCAESLDGRSFDGRLISANAIPLTNYSAMFPDSVNATRILQTKFTH